MATIEGNVLANTLANSATENAYAEVQTTREMLPASEDAQAFKGLANNSVDLATAPQQVPSIKTDMTSTPGDEILKSIQKISDAHTESVNNLLNAASALEKTETVTMAGVLGLQKSLMEFQLQQEIISKATGLINQGTQTLFKNQ